MRSSPSRPVTVVASLLSLLLGCAGVQAPERTVSTGWGVDTAAVTPDWTGRRDVETQARIYRLWASYLETRAGKELNPHSSRFWSSEDQARWPDFDLTWFLAYGRLFDGVRPTVVEIRPTSEDADDEYLIRTLFSAVLGTGPDREVKPLALTRVYAVRQEGRWVLAGALPRLTRTWRRSRVGPITYVHPPGHTLDRERARAAVRFADSVAAALGAPGLEDLTYYVTGSAEEAYRVMGFDWVVKRSLTSGRAFPHNGVVVSGDPDQGEAHLHELVHIVLEPLAPVGATHRLVHEGVATWLGGTLGMNLRETSRAYAEFIESRPSLTLEAVLTEERLRSQVPPAGAALIELVHSHAGMEGVRELLDVDPSDTALRQRLKRILGLSWQGVCRAWRETLMATDGP